MSLVFGRLQYLTSTRMQASPFMAKLFQGVFGYTNVGNYARSKVFKRVLKDLPFEFWQKVLDLGCGYGEYSVLMADLLPKAKITAEVCRGRSLPKLKYSPRFKTGKVSCNAMITPIKKPTMPQKVEAMVKSFTMS